MLFDTFLSNPVAGVVVLASIIGAISVHEASHAFAAVKLGDSTPKLQGRLTLNPLRHLDPWGTLLLIFAGIGWGKPVQFNPYNLKHPRRDSGLIAFAGPASNIVMAVVVAVVARILPIQSILILTVVQYFVAINLVLAVFNLLPIEPLDGFKIVSGVLPSYLVHKWEETRRYGIFILIILLITGAFSRIVRPVVDTALRLLLP